MYREDIDDENKMTRLLQFLGGEAKEAVCGLETAVGGIYQAIKILEERYGRLCMIVSSVVSNFTKGPPIAGGDKAAQRKFADQTTRALATLKSMDYLSEINQGNIICMTERLPKHLQNKFATLAFDLEAKGQSFTTFSDFVSFVNRQACIANHPINQKSTANNSIKNRRLATPLEKTDQGLQQWLPLATASHLPKTERVSQTIVVAVVKLIHCIGATRLRAKHHKKERS